MVGYEALRESAAWIDLSSRGRIRASGEDRARFLHAMTTNHIQQLQPGQNCYVFFLNPQGRILTDANIVALTDSFVIDTEPEAAAKLYAHLDHFIIADDVTLEDLSSQWTSIGIEGPKSANVFESMNVAARNDWISAPISATGGTGFRLLLPSSGREALITELRNRAVPEADRESVKTVRLEHGLPRYGEDITEVNLPQETQQMRALHFTKGCYIGQEIVERIRSRGHVNRLLTSLRIDSREAPAAGAKVVINNKEIGEITSAAVSPALGCVVALGYVRAEHVGPQTPVNVAGATGQIAA
jgi:folate-binding protein YgfZ